METHQKIGVFDSGFGGLTIFSRIRTLLPDYDYVYLGDNARTPYGNRSFESVLKFTAEGVDFLFQQGCRIIIIACNTASARALRSIQQQVLPQKYAQHPELRVLGVIRPTVEKMADLTTTQAIALWATSGTVRSGSFLIEGRKFAPGVQLIQTACPLLVPLVEAGELGGAGVHHFVSQYWNATLQQESGKHVDTLLLACTHYPLLQSAIESVVPGNVKIVTQGDLVSASLQDYMRRHPEMESSLSRKQTARFFTTDQCEYFDHLAEIFMGHRVSSEMAR